VKRFRGLGPKQEEVFRQIAFGHDGAGCPRKTLEMLERNGLIESYDEATYGPSSHPIDRIPLMVRKYQITSIALHMEYCQWCSEVCPDGQ
jgi:hypothetical protein